MNESESQSGESDLERIWTVYRIDDNGNTFVVQESLTREEANRLVSEFEARGHKQMYWAEEKRK
jgi:UDP-N-acetyl-2-amino-2-deoxyglucuronate dehydrogenase